ncbi:hypothetical protein KFL_002710090 [Klebsormidium nitens]|uniref:Uncharacterized protein n=1 Tax=Klebsormidium nitens TaxID=105231 RepID=A0A1Y1I586_KLENI|nr:hypothetical protein KFL_002710090 [Klebsormidium nitens]|eukprot:GAQ86114.1 hypothetical protein KFL_002710090 [Klebsormidium nitens]
MASTCAAPVTGHVLAAASFAGAQQSHVAARPGLVSSSFVGRPALRVQSPLHTAFGPPSSPDAACPCVGQLQVRAAKRSRFNNGGRGPGGTAQQGPPPIDFGADDNPKFILFVRATGGAIPEWFPLSIIDGGTQAQGMLSQMKSDFGKKIFQNTLTRNIAGAIYKGDPKEVIKAAVRQYPILKEAKGYEFAYKVADKDKPRESMMGVGVTRIPPKEELTNVVDKIKGLFSKSSGTASSTSS